jgi:hypothetical protein
VKNISLRIFVIASLVLFGSLYYYSGEVQDHYQDNASQYLDLALTEISRWDAEVLKDQLAREAKAQVSDEQLQTLMDHYRHLGRYQSMDSPQLSRLSAALSIFSDQAKLSYSSRVSFSEGSAIMTATLTVENQRFKLYNFSLGQSEATKNNTES